MAVIWCLKVFLSVVLIRKNRDAALEAKIALGEAGDVWWSDGAPDYSGSTPDVTPYAQWWSSLSEDERAAGS